MYKNKCQCECTSYFLTVLHTRARTRTHTRTHAHTHTRARAHANTHTHTEKIYNTRHNTPDTNATLCSDGITNTSRRRRRHLDVVKLQDFARRRRRDESDRRRVTRCDMTSCVPPGGARCARRNPLSARIVHRGAI